jgi:hypothetical protein
MAAWRATPQRRRVGVVGLGAGALAAFSEPGEHWTFFEIDPVVVDIARDRGLFTYLADARGLVDVVVGDARQTLVAAPDGTFGVLVLDAFGSDSIPAHLLTCEALASTCANWPPASSRPHPNRTWISSPSSGAAGALGLASLTRGDFVSAGEPSRQGVVDLTVVARTRRLRRWPAIHAG